MKTYHFRTLLAFTLLLFPLLVCSQGILFSEHRLLLEKNKMHTLQVCNPTKEVRTFQLSVIDKTVDDNHRIVDLPDSTKFDYSIKSQVRVFPRRITLAPSDCQEIQIQLRDMASMPEGEYRSYLHFLPLLNPIEEKPDTTQRKSNAPSFDIIIRIGAAIPLIYRKHTQPSKLLIDSVALAHSDDTKPSSLSFYIHREGNQSVFGDFHIYDIQGDEKKDAGTALGNAIYAEAPGRRISIPIAQDSLRVTPSGSYKLKIVYTDSENQDRKDILCEWMGELK